MFRRKKTVQNVKCILWKASTPSTNELVYSLGWCTLWVASSKPNPPDVAKIQGDQLKMTVFLCYLVKSDLSSVHVNSSVHWSSHFSQGTRKTHPVFGRIHNRNTMKRAWQFLHLCWWKRWFYVHEIFNKSMTNLWTS